MGKLSPVVIQDCGGLTEVRPLTVLVEYVGKRKRLIGTIRDMELLWNFVSTSNHQGSIFCASHPAFFQGRETWVW